MPHHRPLIPLLALAAAVLLAGCGSGGGTSGPTVLPARVFALSGFQPAGSIQPGKRTLVSFTIRTPSGKPLTRYKKCCDPHAGVDLLVVRSDDSHVQYIDADAEAATGSSSTPTPKSPDPRPRSTSSSSNGSPSAATTGRNPSRHTGLPRWSTATASKFRATPT